MDPRQNKVDLPTPYQISDVYLDRVVAMLKQEIDYQTGAVAANPLIGQAMALIANKMDLAVKAIGFLRGERQFYGSITLDFVREKADLNSRIGFLIDHAYQGRVETDIQVPDGPRLAVFTFPDGETFYGTRDRRGETGSKAGSRAPATPSSQPRRDEQPRTPDADDNPNGSPDGGGSGRTAAEVPAEHEASDSFDRELEKELQAGEPDDTTGDE